MAMPVAVSAANTALLRRVVWSLLSRVRSGFHAVCGVRSAASGLAYRRPVDNSGMPRGLLPPEYRYFYEVANSARSAKRRSCFTYRRLPSAAISREPKTCSARGWSSGAKPAYNSRRPARCCCSTSARRSPPKSSSAGLSALAMAVASALTSSGDRNRDERAAAHTARACAIRLAAMRASGWCRAVLHDNLAVVERLAAVIKIATLPQALAVPVATPVSSVKEPVAFAKRPG